VQVPADLDGRSAFDDLRDEPTVADLAMAFEALMTASEKIGCIPMALEQARRITAILAAPGREFMATALLQKCDGFR